MSGDRFFVTGCASGIGRRVAGSLARRGKQVFAVDVNLEGLRRAANEDGWDPARVYLQALDVSDAVAWLRAVEAAVEKLGGDIDVLLNIAGIIEPGFVHALDERAVHRQIDVNLKGVIFGTRAVVPRMLARRSGHIVNMASMAALVPIPGLPVYSATKFAVRAFSLAAAIELRPRGVHVTVVCPDAVRTPMLDHQKSYEAAAMTFSGRALEIDDVERVLLGRVLTERPLEVAIPRFRGLAARIANFWSQLALWLAPGYQRRGRLRQRVTPSLD